MIILHDNFKIKLDKCTYIALGSFDGLHLGHLTLIDKAKELAKASNCSSMIYTFENHPLTIINEDMVPKLLCSNNYKIEILDGLGIDILNLASFNDEFMKLTPESFIENLIGHYKAKGLVVGFNYRFGYKNLGDVLLLKELSKKLNFELYVMDAVKLSGKTISSSKIRNHLLEGEIPEANKLLGHPFMLEGKVIEGKQLGRLIGFPTINLDYDKKFVLPLGGVYFTIAEYQHELYKGLTNIGYNPTVNGNKLSVETYLLNFNKFIYNENIRIYFKKRIRDEKKFHNIEDLICALKKDKAYARNQKLEI